MLHTVGAVPSRRTHTSTQPARTRSGGKRVCERDGYSQPADCTTGCACVGARARGRTGAHSFIHAPRNVDGRRPMGGDLRRVARRSRGRAAARTLPRSTVSLPRKPTAPPPCLSCSGLPRRTCVRRERCGARGEGQSGAAGSQGRPDRAETGETGHRRARRASADERSEGMPASACGTPFAAQSQAGAGPAARTINSRPPTHPRYNITFGRKEGCRPAAQRSGGAGGRAAAAAAALPFSSISKASFQRFATKRSKNGP